MKNLIICAACSSVGTLLIDAALGHPLAGWQGGVIGGVIATAYVIGQWQARGEMRDGIRAYLRSLVPVGK
jgi:hypothetical protein